jgi:hypothetical protein
MIGMPTYFRTHGHIVFIFYDDHPPPHVHVTGPDGEVVFMLNCPNGPLEIREQTRKLTDSIVRKLARAITPEIQRLCAMWRTIHGAH